MAEVSNYVAAMNHGLERLADAARLGPADPRDPRRAAGRACAAAELHPGELRTSQNWIGPPACTLERQRRSFRPRPRDCPTPRRPGALPPRRGRPPAADQDRPRARAVRDDPPVPRRQRPRRPAADHLPALRKSGAGQAGAVPVALFQDATDRAITSTCKPSGIKVRSRNGSNSS